MFHGCRILVAEDEAIVAFEIAQAIEDTDGVVVGPVSSVREGLALLAREDVDAAILDVNLTDRDVAPLAAALLERRKPIVFYTASSIPAEITARYGKMKVCGKPMPSEQLVLRLARLFEHVG
jgi:DNA-binding NarL/FixJ family response regulator